MKCSCGFKTENVTHMLIHTLISYNGINGCEIYRKKIR
jgi:hypothetical protein